MAFEPAFQPLGDTQADRQRQFSLARSSGSNTEDFWIAVYMLGIDQDIGQPFDELTEAHAAPPACRAAPPVKRSRAHRIIASLTTVRSKWGWDFWRKLGKLGVWIPTHPSTALAGSLSSLALRYGLVDAGRGLQHALQSNRPGPSVKRSREPTPAADGRCVQNGDFERAMSWLDEQQPKQGRTEGHTPAPRARKKRKPSPPSPEQARRYSRGSARTSLTAQDTADTEIPSSPLSRASPPPPQSNLGDPLDELPSLSDALSDPLLRADAPRHQSSPSPAARRRMPPSRAHTPTMGRDPSPYTVVAEIYVSLRSELEAAYTAVKDAQTALSQARETLEQLEQQIDKTPNPCLAPTPNTDQQEPKERLDDQIGTLEQQKTKFDEWIRKYKTIYADIPQGLVSTAPFIDPQVYERDSETHATSLQRLKTLREKIQEAEANIQHCMEVHQARRKKYRELKKSFNALIARCPKWDPGDEDDGSSSDGE